MSELTDRGKAFRATIAGLIEARRCDKLPKALKDALKNYKKSHPTDANFAGWLQQARRTCTALAQTYDYATWLADAASRAHNLKVVTHPIKFTHSGIKGAASVHAGTSTHNSALTEIGTHSVAVPVKDFAISDAKHLDVYSLLKEIVDGKPLLDWLQEDDADLAAALSEDHATAVALMGAFKQVLKPDEKVTSHPLAKQIYWLTDNENPSDDGQYHLLQPMFSSSLEHAVHEDIRGVREAGFSARGTRKQKPTFADHSTYPGLVARTLGGSNAQNVSPQNKVRGGVNYLLASLPPAAWRPPQGRDLRAVESVFDEKRGAFFYFGEVSQLIRNLADFLKTDPDRNKETRNRVDSILRAIADELAEFGVATKARYPAGWTGTEGCRLLECEQLWLDPERSEDDAEFKNAYDFGNWADEVATRFGLWLNGQLRKRSDTLATLGEAEMRHFARQAILDVAWPIPMQRRAKAGAA